MKILIVCTGNTCRSPMAEGIFKTLAKENNLDVQVQSAGTFAFGGDGASYNAIKALEALNIDISNHRSQLVHWDLIGDMDLIFTMTLSHKDAMLKEYPDLDEKIFLLNEFAFGVEKDIMDPYGGSLEVYEKVRDEIYKAAEGIVVKLSNGGVL
ncbi:low molecular weight protein arginine phosphatase [Tissierella creatinini]|nr:low molecular weight protein arginine phosphatase [Tissierella creatinini]TJX63862.1 low molecular weight protein arginine phosphatase [Soehngenia saccharolytica]